MTGKKPNKKGGGMIARKKEECWVNMLPADNRIAIQFNFSTGEVRAKKKGSLIWRITSRNVKIKKAKHALAVGYNLLSKS